MPVAIVAAILGHSSLRTIHRYVHPSAEAQRAAMQPKKPVGSNAPRTANRPNWSDKLRAFNLDNRSAKPLFVRSIPTRASNSNAGLLPSPRNPNHPPRRNPKCRPTPLVVNEHSGVHVTSSGQHLHGPAARGE